MTGNRFKIIFSIFCLILLLFHTKSYSTRYKVGEVVDTFNSVKVYYNGSVGHVAGRNRAKCGYNLGLKYQCVEFVKRYYYKVYKHKMPNSYGHAKDFYNYRVKDGKLNRERGLIQYRNSGKSRPAVGDLIVFAAHEFNPYGHVAIVSKVTKTKIEIVQQNPGPTGKSRQNFDLSFKNGRWKVLDSGVLCWLRKIKK